MMTSMTGYSCVSGEVKGFRFNIEARSLNHRFLEFKAKLPAILMGMEYELENLAKKYFERGKVEVLVTVEGEPEEIELKWSRPMARAFVKILGEMEREFQIAAPIDLQLLVNQKNVIIQEPERWGKETRPELEKIFQQCFELLVEARKREGERLEMDMVGRLGLISKLRTSISSKQDVLATEARNKLNKRVEQLVGEGIALDRGRLEQELAILAARSDITEELERIGSHLEQFNLELKKPGAKGKKLDFLTQELNREFNTIGAKGQNAEVSQWVIEAKSELERIRQQLQNIE
jgi:uncharacterized protein (TIGR00255 family)